MAKGISKLAVGLGVTVIIAAALGLGYTQGYITFQAKPGQVSNTTQTQQQTATNTTTIITQPSTNYQVQQSTSVTLTAGSFDGLNVGSGKVWLANYLLIENGANGSPQLVNLTLGAAAAGGTQSVTFNPFNPQTYTLWVETNATYYGKLITFTVKQGDPVLGGPYGNANPAQPILQVPTTKIGQVNVALWESTTNNGLINSTYATTSEANLSAATTNSSLNPGGAADSFRIYANEPNNFQAFGDLDARAIGGIAGIIVCTDAKQSKFTTTPKAPSGSATGQVLELPVAVPSIATSNGDLYCWNSNVDQVTTANSPAEIFDFGLSLNSGQSFASTRWDIYDGTSFLSTDGKTVLYGYNDNSAAFNDLGSADSKVVITQQTTAFEA